MNSTRSSPTARTAAGVVLLAAGLASAALLPGPRWLSGALALVLGALAAGLFLGARVNRRELRHAALRRRLARMARGPGADAGDEDQPSSGRDLDTLEQCLADAAARAVEHRRRLLALVDAVDAPVVATDERGLVTLCNHAAESLVGTRAEKLLGRPVDEAFTQADLLRLHASARSGRSGQERVRIARPDGVAVFEASATAVPAAAPPDAAPSLFPVVITLRDVTELSRSIQVKSDFVANASHELRTPIAALRIAVETLQSEASEDAAMRERLIGVIEGNTNRLEEMVRDLLDLSRLESPEVPVRVGPVAASDLRDALAPLFETICRERALTLTFDLAPGLEHMRTDRDLLTLILKNLVENATKFAYERTEVRVVGRAVPGATPDGQRSHDAARPQEARAVRFDVIDQGIGIPLSQQQRIFERYYQVDPARTGSAPRRGSGLGLAIVKHAVRTLGGTIRVHSVWKQGTTMTVELPGALT